MAGTGQIILAEDYNEIYRTIRNVMSTGVSTYGYGQYINSSEVPLGAQVTKLQWDNLRYDIINARVHQTGDVPTITEVQITDPIRYGSNHPNFQYKVLADQSSTDRFSLGLGQFVVESGVSQTRLTSWGSEVSCEVTVTFSTVDQARFFFNSGGKIRFNSTRTGGSTTNQNSTWTNLLNSIGSVDFGGNTTGVNFYQLTSSYQNFKTQQLNSVYSSVAYGNNSFFIQAKCNVSDNSAGTARIVYFKVIWRDLYTDPGTPPPPSDAVDGTLTLTVSEVRAQADSILPSSVGQSFTITRPTYSVTSITGS